ncbi:uncharacterized protein LOC112880167 isoform X3 [Panicum hallii]|uniref:uncharacterized protein LOC112880167 isoform X3 n=1 Tax=Panicum hallii TaxID=206008 RepID=UPI000DF4E3A7|nr:uncharacterized protein LOC112880167 isoform X3 [Panicum hallii]
MEFAAGARVAPRPATAVGFLPARDRRVGGGAIGIGWPRRAAAPKLSLPPAVARRAVSAAGGGGHLLPRCFVARPAGGSDGGFRREAPARASPPDAAEGATTARNSVSDHAEGIRRELMNLAVPAIVGQAIDPVAQLMETAYIGRLAAVGVSVFNIISKLFNIPLLSITTSFVAEDVSKHDSSQPASVAGELEVVFGHFYPADPGAGEE